jgi:hypothetical protein
MTWVQLNFVKWHRKLFVKPHYAMHTVVRDRARTDTSFREHCHGLGHEGCVALAPPCHGQGIACLPSSSPFQLAPPACLPCLREQQAGQRGMRAGVLQACAMWPY